MREGEIGNVIWRLPVPADEPKAGAVSPSYERISRNLTQPFLPHAGARRC